jgi:hypothetical protein
MPDTLLPRNPNSRHAAASERCMHKGRSLVGGLFIAALVGLAWWALETGWGPFGGAGRKSMVSRTGSLEGDGPGPSLEGNPAGRPPNPLEATVGTEQVVASHPGRKVVLDVRDPGRLLVAGARLRLLQWDSSFLARDVNMVAEAVSDERGEAVLVVTAGMDLSQDGWLLFVEPPAVRRDLHPLRR